MLGVNVLKISRLDSDKFPPLKRTCISFDNILLYEICIEIAVGYVAILCGVFYVIIYNC